MHPVLVDLGGFTISTFGIMMVAGFLAAWALLTLEFARKGLPTGDAQTAVLIAALGGVVGARLYYLADHSEELASDFAGTITSRGGLTWYGGFFLATLLLALFLRARRIPLLRGLDCMAPPLALGYAIGRVGCYLVGDDYGGPASLPWAVAFPEGAPPIVTAVHPTQVYETLSAVLVFGVLWRLRTLPAPEGATAFLCLVLVGLERLLIEFLRVNPPVALGLTQAQMISLAVVLLGSAGLAAVSAGWRRRRAAPITA
ncbi:MAG: prolipoprotein diacylglyceryl transferase [Gemmatimonadetes bacterium]|nr:prolipoprotein diacylglyceryl transferase [Gemmatimonadota bacterium]